MNSANLSIHPELCRRTVITASFCSAPSSRSDVIAAEMLIDLLMVGEQAQFASWRWQVSDWFCPANSATS